MYKPDPRIQPYLDHVAREVNAYVSSSHVTLYNIGREHGHDVIKQLLDEHFRTLEQLRNR